MQQGSLIVAMTRHDYIIGKQGKLPWHLPCDLAWFKKVTMGKTILMGAKTFNSIGNKPLPGRTNLVLSRSKITRENSTNLIYFNSWHKMLNFAKSQGDWVVIGGSSLYALALDSIDKMYITWIDAKINGDTKFPNCDFNQWQCVFTKTHMKNEKNQHAFEFSEYIRKTEQPRLYIE